MTDEKDDYTIYYYFSHYLTSQQEKHGHVFLVMQKPKVLNDDSFILRLEEISHKGEKMRPITHEKRLNWERAVLP